MLQFTTLLEKVKGLFEKFFRLTGVMKYGRIVQTGTGFFGHKCRCQSPTLALSAVRPLSVGPYFVIQLRTSYHIAIKSQAHSTEIFVLYRQVWDVMGAVVR